MNPLVLAGTTFAASLVEFVEAATIVFAVGVTHGWRAALGGTAAAALALAAIVLAGAPLVVMIDALVAWIQLVAGPLLVLFGAWWLRKAILRYAGRKAMHDETAIYAREVTRLRAEHVRGFAVAFQGVFIEGFEVAVIVITFAAGAPSLIGWSSGGALAALLAVAFAAFALRAPLARMPENLLKTIVAIMLLSLGTFWTGEGAGLRWPLHAGALFAIAACYAALSAALVALLRMHRAPSTSR